MESYDTLDLPDNLDTKSIEEDYYQDDKNKSKGKTLFRRKPKQETECIHSYFVPFKTNELK